MRNFTILLAKKMFLAEPKPVCNCGRTSQRLGGGIGKAVGVLGSCLLMLTIGFTDCRCQALSSQWRSAPLLQHFSKGVGRAQLGRDLAFSGPLGCCGFAHSIQRLECSGEVRAARRALFLPHREGALRSYKGIGVQALSFFIDE